MNYIAKPGIGVNVHSGPGTNTDKVGGYEQGAAVDVLE